MPISKFARQKLRKQQAHDEAVVERTVRQAREAVLTEKEEPKIDWASLSPSEVNDMIERRDREAWQALFNDLTPLEVRQRAERDMDRLEFKIADLRRQREKAEKLEREEAIDVRLEEVDREWDRRKAVAFPTDPEGNSLTMRCRYPGCWNHLYITQSWDNGGACDACCAINERLVNAS